MQKYQFSQFPFISALFCQEGQIFPCIQKAAATSQTTEEEGGKKPFKGYITKKRRIGVTEKKSQIKYDYVTMTALLR